MPYKPIEEYKPKQRGIVAAAKKKKGNSLLRNGDVTGDECPYCGVLLRVRREKRGPLLLACPCGHEEEVEKG